MAKFRIYLEYSQVRMRLSCVAKLLPQKRLNGPLGEEIWFYIENFLLYPIFFFVKIGSIHPFNSSEYTISWMQPGIQPEDPISR
jgi:hypothetical protein